MTGIRHNVYESNPVADPAEFILLAVQHYYIIHGKDVEPDKMKQIVQDLMPTPYIASQNGDEKSKDKKTKPLMSEKQIDSIVESAIEKDSEVSRRACVSRSERRLILLSSSNASSNG